METRIEEITDTLSERFHYTEEELETITPKLEEIYRIRNEKGATLLAHYYQIPPIHMIADFKGDSLYLAQRARELQGEGLVVCSMVVFMAEMVKLLSPNKKVVVPNMEAGCSIAEGINGTAIEKIRERFPDSGIVAYVNTYAATKAKVDVICTSSNAEHVVRKTRGDPLIMLPDYFFSRNTFNGLKERNDRKYLAYKEERAGKLVLVDAFSEEEHLIDTASFLPILQRERGTCVVHEQFTRDQVVHLRRKDKIDVVMSHPEVNTGVAAVSDFVGGTARMIEYVRDHPDKKRYLVISECDLTAPLIDSFPDREFVTPCILCPYMKKNYLDGVIDSLRNERYEINLDAKTAEGARRSLNRMFEITR